MIPVPALFLAIALLAAPEGTALPTGYDAELQGLERQIVEAPAGAARAALLYRRASLTADFAQFRQAEAAIDEALRGAPSAELLLLRASFNLKMHRLARAKADLAAIPELSERPAVRTLLAQIALQEGDYEAARRAYETAVEESHAWDSLAGLAHYRANTAGPAAADALYVEAEDEITAKQMRSYAWVELQRGILHFDRRRYRDALAHYRRAERAYSGYWLVEEHIAEALHRVGRTAEAVALYKRIIEKTHDPEHMSALAGIVERSDRTEAARLHAEADLIDEDRLRMYPEAAAGHLIRRWLARKDPPLARLLALARRNVELRPNAEAKILLAKAYWKANEAPEARRLVAEVMETPWRAPELLAFAEEIRRARDSAPVVSP